MQSYVYGPADAGPASGVAVDDSQQEPKTEDHQRKQHDAQSLLFSVCSSKERHRICEYY